MAFAAAFGYAARGVRPRKWATGFRAALRSWEIIDFAAGVHRIAVRYRNHRDEHKTFGGDRRTLRRRGRHISLNVEPTGRRIALAANRIQNLDEVESALGRLPTPREAQVLAYHARRGTTSERYEALRQKYPDWSPYK